MELSTALDDVGNRDNVPLSKTQLTSSPSNQPPGSQQDEARTIHVPSAPERLVPVLADMPFAQGENAKTYFTRPNRYFGPASTWKSWTEEERTITESIDAMHCRDLGIHLVNSFALKRKASVAILSGRGRKRRRTTEGKDRANPAGSMDNDADTASAHEDANTTVFSMPKCWTAWPLPPDKVPREEFLPMTALDMAFRSEVDTRPSTNLEQCLISNATKIARDRWETRQWDNTSSELKTDTKAHTPKAGSEFEGNNATTENDGSEGDGHDMEEEQSSSEDAQFPMFSSRAFSASNSPEPKWRGLQTERNADQTLFNDKPVPIADDDKAAQYFLPSARHVLSKLDDLLLGLHKARYPYASKPYRKSSVKILSTSEERAKSTGLGRSSSRSTFHRSRSGKPSPAARDSSNFSSMSQLSAGKTRPLAELGLRDWSDVVGMASLTGWDPAVVERASERCGRLFGENMLFRVFHEGEAKEVEKSHSIAHLAVDSEVSEEANEEAFGASHTCPHESCPRHSVPFRKTAHLQQHLEEVHVASGGNRSRSRSRMSASRGTSVDFSDVDVDMLAHPDVIICPVAGCKRGQKPFPTGRRLYEHIKRIHPEVDVKTVKQMESRRRGERRGRWSKEKIRQRSLSQRRAASPEDIGKQSPLELDEDDDDDDD
ncbi:hypothetical protein PV08_05023 [Exophiala spinifera]|uniref:C2H2-type domain-containing protein n=1 Tax=Exophiala spinifera TaxID=91928 RepID=A0A0D2BFP1_9EURO|nr:uncharacterized protein PV08_05023 [Exophiala spinifera]KIW17828.1 hypothetical protein PV08_05023 [Exophiala spinifera]